MPFNHCRFLPSISIFSRWTWYMINMFISNHIYVCHLFFMSCAEPPMSIYSVCSFTVWSGGSLTNFPVPLGVGKLSLNMQNFLHTCVRSSHRMLAYFADKLMGYVYNVCCFICTSVMKFIHLSVHLNIYI